MVSRILVAAGLFTAAVCGILLADRLEDTTYVPYEHKAIQYFETVTTEPVRHLDDLLDQGKAKLEYEPGGLGYLPSLLKHFDINPDSQVMVYMADSFQAPLISPPRPRAVYFNDNIAVGFVQNGEVYEVSALDPKQGVAFYTLNTRKTDKPGLPGVKFACNAIRAATRLASRGSWSVPRTSRRALSQSMPAADS